MTRPLAILIPLLLLSGCDKWIGTLGDSLVARATDDLGAPPPPPEPYYRAVFQVYKSKFFPCESSPVHSSVRLQKQVCSALDGSGNCPPANLTVALDQTINNHAPASHADGGTCVGEEDTAWIQGAAGESAANGHIQGAQLSNCDANCSGVANDNHATPFFSVDLAVVCDPFTCNNGLQATIEGIIQVAQYLKDQGSVCNFVKTRLEASHTCNLDAILEKEGFDASACVGTLSQCRIQDSLADALNGPTGLGACAGGAKDLGIASDN